MVFDRPKDSGRPLKLGHQYGSAESKVGRCGSFHGM